MNTSADSCVFNGSPVIELSSISSSELSCENDSNDSGIILDSLMIACECEDPISVDDLTFIVSSPTKDDDDNVRFSDEKFVEIEDTIPFDSVKNMTVAHDCDSETKKVLKAHLLLCQSDVELDEHSSEIHIRCESVQKVNVLPNESECSALENLSLKEIPLDCIQDFNKTEEITKSFKYANNYASNDTDHSNLDKVDVTIDVAEDLAFCQQANYQDQGDLSDPRYESQQFTCDESLQSNEDKSDPTKVQCNDLLGLKAKRKGSGISDFLSKFSRKSTENLNKTKNVISTTALIPEHRPRNLPSKDRAEAMKHHAEYEEILRAAKKRELKATQDKKKAQEKQLEVEASIKMAAKLWADEILPSWSCLCNCKRTRQLWWQGLPPNVRGKVWKLAIGNDLNVTEELYQICLVRAKDRLKQQEEEDLPETASCGSRESSVELITLDVSRTFPHLCIFQKGGPYHELLHGLLGAYVCFRPDVGYVQGMSYVAAILLLNMSVSDSFISFANLLNRPCLVAFFRLDESLMKNYFDTFEEFFRDLLPLLYDHFLDQGLTPDLYIMDWMLSLFTKCLPLDVACRVWDMFCRDGEYFLFLAALGILRYYQDRLIGLDFIHLAQFLTKLPENISSEGLFSAIADFQLALDLPRFTSVFNSHRVTRP